MKNLINYIKENYKLVVGTLILGLFLGWLFFHSGGGSNATRVELEGHEGHNHKSEEATVWTCSMHPQIKQDKPGDCPICGMDLIPMSSLKSDGDNVNPNEIAMSESAAKLAEIQTVIVTKGKPQKDIFLQGKVHADERNIAELTARFGGRIEKLFINFTGQQVKKGEKLATIYSPGLVTAQRELLEAISFKDTRPSLYAAARGKLKLWDLTDEQIATIEEHGEPQLYFDVLSPISGTVMMRHVALGDYIKEGIPLFKVIDLSKVWVMFDAYESDLPWVKLGDKMEISVPALPGQHFEAKVSYIDPFIDAASRVAKVRVELSNKKEQLKPEMFANGIVEPNTAEKSNEILIPKSSILWTGKRAVVYVKVTQRETPTFLYREIDLGPEAGAFYVVADGLQAGEEIAVNGVFKIDAAAQLQGLPSMMNPDGGVVSTGHNHGGRPMSQKEIEKMEKEPQHFNVKEDFKKQLTKVYEKYLIMKDAFVSSDAHKVMKAAADLEGALAIVDMGLLKGDAHMVWMEQLTTLENTISSIGKLSDIEKQRTEFANFNLAFYKSLKAFGLNDATAYYQYCPMANRDKGAYWFSDSEEIRNPYFGEDMLTCGEVRETIRDGKPVSDVDETTGPDTSEDHRH
ncbi:efflux RND transporter periplasmic adaptor subunit [Gaoshiqia sediminis]|uniref:Efflux RND transporter periplasmic adaptor subunit n=1 Tax=Gaoshiqia sediminis TaxID=2986998 RepID=A0AA41Y694_9BACT|nr:efflux RND transporter periplasmic adaptor subunit [Gaoshiqia sediminis]MCW0481897.1 efflux RND transporter periplasmic adaptor subunit [Gaoshiqia sediminis]